MISLAYPLKSKPNGNKNNKTVVTCSQAMDLSYSCFLKFKDPKCTGNKNDMMLMMSIIMRMVIMKMRRRKRTRKRRGGE